MSSSLPARRSLLCGLVGTVLFGLLAVGCSAPSSTPTSGAPDAPSPPSAPAFSFLHTTDAGLVLHRARPDTAQILIRGATHDGPAAVSPGGEHLAFTYTTADSTHLALLTLATGALRPIDRRPATATYSLAWSSSSAEPGSSAGPDAQLAYAYYLPVENGTRGPGDVFVVATDGAPRNVGCSAAREVLAWLPDGPLATRNDDKLYVVSAADCATRTAADARRMRAATYAPTGTALAYIHRELTYDREAGDYTADSSLVLSPDHGRSSTELLGPSRRVRHPQWAPDGSELAVDVHVEASGHRQIAVYNVADERTIYLTPPSQTTGDQRFPRWSPSAARVAFTSGRGADATAATRVDGQTRRLGPVDGAVWGWLTDRTLVVPGPDSLRIRSIDGQTRYTHPAPRTLIHAWRDASQPSPSR
jgi:hypothetical protein